jgi:hypothetical protein
VTDDDYNNFLKQIALSNPSIVVYDTETTGLNIIKDKPFLFAIGFENLVYTFEPKKEWLEKLLFRLYLFLLARPYQSIVYCLNLWQNKYARNTSEI